MAFFRAKKRIKNTRLSTKYAFAAMHRHIIIWIRRRTISYMNNIKLISIKYLTHSTISGHYFSIPRFFYIADINQSTSKRFPYFMHRKHIIQLRICSKTINRVYTGYTFLVVADQWIFHSLKSSII